MRRVMLRTRLGILMAVVSSGLVGCNTVGDGGVCSSLRQYSVEEQKRAAAEIRANPNGELAKFVRDYGNVRKACRV
jgi:hypothetical protein